MRIPHKRADALRHARTRATELRTRWSRRELAVVLVFHAVGRVGGDPERQILRPLCPALFDRHLEYVQRHYRVVAASDVRHAMVSRRRGQRIPVALTFDDDLVSHVAEAAPLLRSRGLTATFFLTGAGLEAPHEFWWERLQRAIDAGLSAETASPTLAERGGRAAGWLDNSAVVASWAGFVEQLPPGDQDAVAEDLLRSTGPDRGDSGLRADAVVTLLALGMEIGFHTLRHRRLPSLSDDELANALVEGRGSLERIVGRPLTTVAYPHGKVDQRTAPAARKAGYLQGFTTRPEAVTSASEPLALPRIAPSLSSTRHLARQLAMATRTAHGSVGASSP